MTDYALDLAGFAMGAGTDYIVGETGIDGLGNPKAKTQDVPLDGQNGSYGGPDFLDVRVLLVPLVISFATDVDAWNALAALNTAWLPVTADVALAITLPGVGTWTFTGRPRSVEANVQYAYQGVITTICEFDALDPVAT